MTTWTADRNDRINLRLKHSAKLLIERAATFEGKTVSSFILSSVLASAEKTFLDCGIGSLNRYLQPQAGQDMRRQISRVFVARPPESKSQVLGYWTLSAVSIDLSALPAKVTKKLPKHPVPAALIG